MLSFRSCLSTLFTGKRFIFCPGINYLQVVEAVYLNMEEHDLFSMMKDSKHREGFVEFLVKSDKIRKLIVFTIKHAR